MLVRRLSCFGVDCQLRAAHNKQGLREYTAFFLMWVHAIAMTILGACLILLCWKFFTSALITVLRKDWDDKAELQTTVAAMTGAHRCMHAKHPCQSLTLNNGILPVQEQETQDIPLGQPNAAVVLSFADTPKPHPAEPFASHPVETLISPTEGRPASPPPEPAAAAQSSLRYLQASVESGIVAGFQIACANGPLCDEPMWGVAFEVCAAEQHNFSMTCPNFS